MAVQEEGGLPPPPPKTKVTIVRKNETCHWPWQCTPAPFCKHGQSQDNDSSRGGGAGLGPGNACTRPMGPGEGGA